MAGASGRCAGRDIESAEVSLQSCMGKRLSFATIGDAPDELIGVALAARILRGAWPEGFHDDVLRANA